MFPNYEIMLQGFIPKSLGKPLREHFRNDPNYGPDRIINFQEFEQFLNRADSLPGTWLREPVPISMLQSFYLTNDGEIGHHKDYKVRLAGTLNLAKTGRYSPTERPLQVVRSSDTHRCTAFLSQIRPMEPLITVNSRRNMLARFYGPEARTPVVTGHYVANTNILRQGNLGLPSLGLPANLGSIGGQRIRRSQIDVATASPRYGPPAPKALEPYYPYNASIIDAWASGGYPFITFSPGITLGLNVSLTWLGNAVKVTITATHDRFPAYELYANGRLLYSYDPVKTGHFTGPNSLNLLSDRLNVLPASMKLGEITFTHTEIVPVPTKYLNGGTAIPT
jgi:hypothetical protein